MKRGKKMYFRQCSFRVLHVFDLKLLQTTYIGSLSFTYRHSSTTRRYARLLALRPCEHHAAFFFAHSFYPLETANTHFINIFPFISVYTQILVVCLYRICVVISIFSFLFSHSLLSLRYLKKNL